MTEDLVRHSLADVAAGFLANGCRRDHWRATGKGPGGVYKSQLRICWHQF
jgi:hypothetical protein